MEDLLNALVGNPPGQKIAHRRLASYGPVFAFNNAIYSYPTTDPLAENDAYKSSYWGLSLFFILSLAITSYSWWDMLIVVGLGLLDAEYHLIPHGAYDTHGISGVLGWLGGYLVARCVSRSRNWASLGGIYMLEGYIEQWAKSRANISHETHLSTLLMGFIAGVVLEHFGPKPMPFQLLKTHSFKFAILCALSIAFIPKYLEYIWPDPPGFIDPHNDPEAHAARIKELDDKNLARVSPEEMARLAAQEERLRLQKLESERLFRRIEEMDKRASERAAREAERIRNAPTETMEQLRKRQDTGMTIAEYYSQGMNTPIQKVRRI